jgi:hypothetical protein
MNKYYKKQGRDFVVFFCEKERKVFIGTAKLFSDVAAQLVSHSVIAPLKWKQTKSCMNLTDARGCECIAVGYKFPLFCDTKKCIKKVDALFD